jgi:putative endonuclease
MGTIVLYNAFLGVQKKDLEIRIAQHNAGKGPKYTRSRLPVKLVAASGELSRSDTLKVEYAVKQQPAGRKVDALKGWIDLQREKSLP